MKTIQELREEAIEIGFKGKEIHKYIQGEKQRQEENEFRKRQMEIDRELELKRIETEANRGDQTTSNGNNSEVDTNRPSYRDRLDRNLPNYNDSEDLDSYLLSFELTATRCGIPKTQWADHLHTKLSAKLRQFMTTQDMLTNRTNYDTTKTQLLRQAGYNSETYRAKWNSLAPVQDDFRSFQSNLIRTLDNWIDTTKTPKTFDGLRDLLCLNKILLHVNTSALKSILLKEPKNCPEVLAQVDMLKSIHDGKISRPNSYKTMPIVDAAAAIMPQSAPRYRSRSVPRNSGSIVCYACNKMGHIANECRLNRTRNAPVDDVTRVQRFHSNNQSPQKPGGYNYQGNKEFGNKYNNHRQGRPQKKPARQF